MNCNRRSVAKLISGLALVLLAGCGGATNSPVQTDLARSTLEHALTQWKSGKSIDESQNWEPKVVIQDFDWMAGHKLTNFQILDQKAKDANLFVHVKLQLDGETPREQVVEYCVGTDPVLTVFRTLESGGIPE